MKNFPIKKYSKISDFCNDYIEILKKGLASNLKNTKVFDKIASKVEKKIKENKQIFVCGNGGSAAIANHFLVDYAKILKAKNNLVPKIISLSNSVELITAVANDISYDEIFKFQLENLANKNDLVILVSSSGNSKNICKALNFCKKKGIFTIGFSGFSGGLLKKNSDLSLYVPIKNYGIVEDIHHIYMHQLMQFIRQKNIKKTISKIQF